MLLFCCSFSKQFDSLCYVLTNCIFCRIMYYQPIESEKDDDSFNDDELNSSAGTISELHDLDPSTVDYAFHVTGIDSDRWASAVNAPDLPDTFVDNDIPSTSDMVRNEWGNRLDALVGIEGHLAEIDSSDESNASDPDYVPIIAGSSTRNMQRHRLSNTPIQTTTQAAETDADDAVIFAVVEEIHADQCIITPRLPKVLRGCQSGNKKLRCAGKEYYSLAVKCKCTSTAKNANGFCCCQFQRARVVAEVNCRCGCKDKISEAHRHDIHASFYNLLSYAEQNGFICNLVRGAKRKDDSELIRTSVRTFIQSLPAQKPHYSRSSGCLKDAYIDLDGIDSLNSLYNRFKKDSSSAGGVKIASRTTFLSVFNTEYKIGLARPIKDKCNNCTKYKNLDDDEKFRLADDFKLHRLRSKQAKEAKERDKLRAKNEETVECFTVDMQSVLYTPHSTDATLFYTRKLAFYNFTIWDQATKDVQCYLWSEVDGKRGSNEIASCLFEKFQLLPDTCQHVVIYSDICGGQNRNRQLMAFFLYMVENSGLLSITQKFMESGHSEMEVDTAHSLIKLKNRKTKIYNREGWRVILESAREKQPFEVIDMQYHNFYDLKDLYDQYEFKEQLKGVDGLPLSILKIKQILYLKTNDKISMFYNYGFDENGFIELDMVSSTKRNAVFRRKMFKKAYTALFPISAPKKADLVGLVKKGIIPLMASQFYLNLPSTDGTIDRLADPAEDELTETEF